MLENLIVPVLNRYDLLQSMVSSIDCDVEHLLIIDNGASLEADRDEPLQIPDTIDEVTYLPMPANLGVAASWNLGIKMFPYADRWYFASNDVVFHPNALQGLSQPDTGVIVLSDMFPHWQAFSLGYDAVRRVGLFDERFYPAYFEDTDYKRRAEHADVPIVRAQVPMDHQNSSTLKSNELFQSCNSRTFTVNMAYNGDKVSREDYGSGVWDVQVRRENGWE